tara:strand:- start:3631 stop:3858 length:228 start_codon:yes stop_codon:yes gene_type:complete
MADRLKSAIFFIGENNMSCNKLEELITLLEEVKADYHKFYEKGNSAAGTRVRKTMQEVKTAAQDIRIDVQNTKNS